MLTQESREKMILDNRGLAIMFARKYSRGNEEYNDILQCAYEGLIRAVDKYDPERPTKFSTMAVPYIRKYTLKFCVERGIVHIPQMKRYKDAKVQKLSNRVYARTGIRIADEFNSPDSYCEVHDNYVSYGDDPSKRVEDRENHEFLNEAKEELSDREKNIIGMRLDGVGPKATGEKFGCSKQRANQLYNKALKKLQNYMVD